MQRTNDAASDGLVNSQAVSAFRIRGGGLGLWRVSQGRKAG
jgi:hypothetical protein